MAQTLETQTLPADASWTQVTNVAGYITVNTPVYFAYSDTTPTVTGEYTSDRRIDNPSGATLWIRPAGAKQVSYTVVEA